MGVRTVHGCLAGDLRTPEKLKGLCECEEEQQVTRPPPEG